jgi:Raf kinase inhibitor-like YbhB/YbcL family protein
LNNDWVNTACAALGALLALAAGLVFPALLGPNAPQKEVNMASMTISSPAFKDGDTIPRKFSCDGDNGSPALSWSGIPGGARSLALIADDPDAPLGTFTHWVIYNLPPSLTGLPEGVAKTVQVTGGGTQGSNGASQTGYIGPCPPPGKAHRYFFKLYALDLEPALAPGLSAVKLQQAMQGHILAQGQWMGKYQR